MIKKIINVLTSASLALCVFSAPVQASLGAVSYAAAAEEYVSVRAPKANRSSGTYYTSKGISVSFSAAADADIYYSLNGASYRRYSSPIKISKNSTVKVYAKTYDGQSATRSYTYKLKPRITISSPEGEYGEPLKIYLKSAASGVKYYYTLDGSKPTSRSTAYTGSGISVKKSTQLRVLAVKSGWSKRYITKEYVINETGQGYSSGESILDDYTEKYAYSTLTDKQKKCYGRMFDAAGKHQEDIDISDLNLSKDDIAKTYWAFDYDNPQFFWLGNGYGYSYMSNGHIIGASIMYERTKKQAEAILPDFEEAAGEILDKALEYDNDFDKIKVIHDELINCTEYTSYGPVWKSEADGPLCNGKALCEGYSKAFMYLCQSAGIECICVAGISSGYGHMWNMVKADGDWYHIDVTWDDPIMSNGKPALTYNFYLQSTKTICSDDHKIDNPFPIPSAVKDYDS